MKYSSDHSRTSVSGTVWLPELGDTEMLWSLTLEDDDEFFNILAEKTSCQPVDVRPLLEEWLSDRLNESIYLLVAECLAEQDGGPVRAPSDHSGNVVAQLKAAIARRKAERLRDSGQSGAND